MTNVVGYLLIGVVVATAALVDYPAVAPLAAVVGIIIVHRAWLAGHETGWHEGCTATAHLHDALTEHAEEGAS